MLDYPVWINLSGPFGIQMHHLELSEVGYTYSIVLWAHVQNVRDAVIIKIILADITSTITYKKLHYVKLHCHYIINDIVAKYLNKKN